MLFRSVFFYFFHKQKEVSRVTFLSVSLQGLRGRIFRTTSLVLALTVIIGAFFSDVLLKKSIENTITTGIGRIGADLVIVPQAGKDKIKPIILNGAPSFFFMDAGIAGRVKSMVGVAAVSPQVYFHPLSYLVCCTTENFLVVGYDPVTDFTVAPWIKYTTKDGLKEDDMVVGKMVKLYPGQQISLYGAVLNVAASLEETGIGFFDNSAFVPIATAKRLLQGLAEKQKQGGLRTREIANDLSYTHIFASRQEDTNTVEEIDPNKISALLVKLKPGVNLKAFSERLRQRLPGLAVVNMRASTRAVKEQLTSMVDAFLLPVIIMLLMGVVILSVVFLMGNRERQREIGIMRALGARPVDIGRLIMYDSLVISMIGGVFGILFGGAIMLIFKEHIMTALDMRYIWPGPATITVVLLTTLAVSLTVGILSGLYPAWRASHMEPYQAVRNG